MPFVPNYESYEIVIGFDVDWDALSELDLYYLRIKLFAGVSMSMEANGGLRTESGMYIHCGEVYPTGTEFIQGDINIDGEVNSRDSLLLKKQIAGLEPRVFIVSCDINGDGDIDARDSVLLKKKLAGV